jgi:hypothetical protein
MTPKERVLTALSHCEADRVPTGEFATDYKVIEAVLGRPTFWRAKAKLVKALWEGRRDEIVDSQKREIVDFTLALDIDMVPINCVPPRGLRVPVPRQIDENTWEDDCGNILAYSTSTEDIGIVRLGNKNPSGPNPSIPDALDESELELAKHVMEKLGKTHFIFARPGRAGTGVGYPTGLGIERQYFRIVDDPEGLKRDLLAGAERMAEIIKPFVELGVDGIAIGNDYGHNKGPFMSPRHFREIYFPAMRRQCEIIHAAGKPVIFHSCGNNRLILEMMIEAGMDCYQAIQPVERIEEIKALYGDRLTLWGGVATSSLASGTPEEIRHEVLFSLKHCAPGGGFILGSSHSLTVGTKPENYRMMLDSNRRRGTYPISIPEEIPEPAWAMA